MLIDMHLHSSFSDGELSPEALAEYISSLSVEFASLTDHDTFGGSERFREQCNVLGINTVIGIEIDCAAPEIDYDSEILCYFPEGSPQYTRTLAEKYLEQRLQGIKKIFKHVQETHPQISLESYIAERFSNTAPD